MGVINVVSPFILINLTAPHSFSTLLSIPFGG